MKTLLITLAFLAFSAFSAQQNVYICTGSSSVAYHKTSDCSGLRNCKGTVKKITLQEAQKLNRRACKICYK